MNISTKFPINELAKFCYIKETCSTNDLLYQMLKVGNLPEGYVLYTDFQLKGKGQTENSWESKAGKNVLFSMVLYPQKVPLDQLFILSQLVSLGIKKVLDNYLDGVTVKWPNDIYWNDKKLAGILIENSLQGTKIKTIIGVGLNVNQEIFTSDAPNPVSLKQITGKQLNRKLLLKLICHRILELYAKLDVDELRSEYAKMLYRKDGFHSFKTGTESFQAKIVTVHPDGELELETDGGERRSFYFKEVQFQ